MKKFWFFSCKRSLNILTLDTDHFSIIQEPVVRQLGLYVENEIGKSLMFEKN